MVTTKGSRRLQLRVDLRNAKVRIPWRQVDRVILAAGWVRRSSTIAFPTVSSRFVAPLEFPVRGADEKRACASFVYSAARSLTVSPCQLYE